jgi:DNA polymerase I-like protein with 3'-5' exonuclease and polymerase domains
MGLFGDDFEIKLKETKVKDLIKKAEGKQVEEDPDKILKSKKVTLMDKLALIKENVYKILGKQKQNVLVIRDKKTFENYVTKAIESGRIAIDTETNNSLDPVTCKLMGLCLYYPGGKSAYIPINHTDLNNIKLENQLTEEDCRIQLERINNSGILRIFHNGKFDYEVIKCTCKIAVTPDWDTMICARLLNENERASLKIQYIEKIDSSQAKYDIENLFEHISYAYVEPDIFALYAATDALMTDKLYEYQKKELDKPEYGPHLDMTDKKELKGLRWLFHEVEMPIVVVTAEMELKGVKVDTMYGEKLKEKYNSKLNEIDDQISEVIKTLTSIIEDWKLTPKANEALKIYASKKSKMTKEKLEDTYPNIDDIGRYKLGKAPVEMLENPINLSSPSQLAILFYDILEVPNDSKDGARKTGKDELKSIKEKLAKYLPKLEEIQDEFNEEEVEEGVETALEISEDKLVAFKLGTAAKLADLMLTRRGLAKMVTSFVDVIPDLVKHWPDGRIRFHLNSVGTDTGRYTSGGKLKFMENNEAVVVSGINIQQIPSHSTDIRLLFTADTKNKKIDIQDSILNVSEIEELETSEGWKYPKDLKIGDILVGDARYQIKNIVYKNSNYNIQVENL